MEQEVNEESIKVYIENLVIWVAHVLKVDLNEVVNYAVNQIDHG